jgi:hypothetical protein
MLILTGYELMIMFFYLEVSLNENDKVKVIYTWIK